MKKRLVVKTLNGSIMTYDDPQSYHVEEVIEGFNDFEKKYGAIEPAVCDATCKLYEYDQRIASIKLLRWATYMGCGDQASIYDCKVAIEDLINIRR
jgi:hypothetical protein